MKKRFSFIFLALIMCLFGIFISACNEEQTVELTLDKTNVVIYYGVTEDNEASVNVRVTGKEVGALGLKYDNTNIKIVSSKLSNGSFNLSITPKSKITTDEVSVVVSAFGEVEARFTVSVVVPVEEVLANENQYIVFKNDTAVYNLIDGLSFKPSGCGSFDVEYEIENADAFGNEVLLQNGKIILNETFNKFDTPIRVRAWAMGEGIISSPSAIYDVRVVPSVRGLVSANGASGISMFATYNGSENAEINADGYTLKITNNRLETFSISVKIPSELGVAVDVDDKKDEQNNIMQYLTVDKTSENKSGYTTTTFVFESLNLLPTATNARLYFKFYYTDNNDENLVDNFVICGSGLRDYLNISVVVPLEDVNIQTDVDIYKTEGGEDAYIVFKNYYTGALRYGSIFKFLPYPLSASNNEFVLDEFDAHLAIGVIDNNGNFRELEKGDVVFGGATIYISARAEAVDGRNDLMLRLKGDNNVIKEFLFRVENGTSGLFIVDSVGSVPDYDYNIENSKVNLSAEVGDNLSVILYAPNAEKSQLKYEAEGIEISEVLNAPGYFQIDIDTSHAGEVNKTITKAINTLNGYSVTISVSIIQRILAEDVKVVLAKSSQNLSVIGYINDDFNSFGIKNIKLKNGASVELDYEYTAGAQSPIIEYSYYYALIGDKNYPNAYCDAYLSFDNLLDYNQLADKEFTAYNSVVSSQNMSARNVLTGTAQGKVWIKISLTGKMVNNGKVVNADPIIVYILVEIYNPLTEVVATDADGHEVKNIELRAKDFVQNENDYKITLSLNAVSGIRRATYDKVYLDGAIIKNEDVLGNGVNRTFMECKINQLLKYNVRLYCDTNELEITLLNTSKDFDYDWVSLIRVFAYDFGGIDFKDSAVIGSQINYRSIKENAENYYSCVEFVLELKVLETMLINDVSVTSLKELDINDELYKTILEELGVDAELYQTFSDNYKIYEQIYIDINDLTFGSDNLYRIITDIKPLNAFNKNLIYSFINAPGTPEKLVIIPFNDGVLHIGADRGGCGYIQIVPEKSKANVKTILIPIKIADGNSFETAFEISNLSKIKNKTQHYILTNGQTYELSETLFSGVTFSGGLYGKKHASDIESSIKLNNCSLFDLIGAGAIIRDLTVFGTSEATGMVANSNNGTISNVNVTTYILNDVYVPSAVFVPADRGFAGGIVGINGGQIIGCTFGGSIVAEENGNYLPICAQNDGTVEKCQVIVAKFQFSEQTKDRVILDSKNSYVNGIKVIGNNREFDGDAIEYTLDNYSAHDSLDDSICVKTNFKHSLGKENANYGIVFYYKAVDKTKQEKLFNYNRINIRDLIDCENSSIKAISTGIQAQVYGDYLVLSDVGEFAINIFSVYDYTNYKKITFLSLYYFESFEVYNSDKVLRSSNIINILNGGRAVINTTTQTSVDDIDLIGNDFEVTFNLYKDVDKSEPVYGNFVTNNTLGSHTINANWDDVDVKYLFISILSEYEAKYNELIYNNFVNGFFLELSPILGATDISLDKSYVAIEPKDSVSVVATITTDAVGLDADNHEITTDIIDKSTIEIINENGIDCTDIFDIVVGKTITAIGNGKFAFDITISIKQDSRGIIDYVNSNYDLIVKCKGDSGVIYSCTAKANIHIDPQTISNINVEMYRTINANGTKDTENNKTYYQVNKNFVSSIKPTDSAILEISVYPAYASFDYIDIVSSSNTFAGFAYIPQTLQDAKYYAADRNEIVYESIPNVNGIRIYNGFSDDNEDIATIYLLVYAKNVLDQNAIVNTTITPYYKGEIVGGATSFLTYITVPKEPDLSIDGKSYIYAYVGEQLTVYASIAGDQELMGGKYYVYGQNESDVIIPQGNIAITYLGNNGGNKKYSLTFTVPKLDDYFVLNENTAQLKLFVQSYKIDKGERVDSIPSTFSIFVSEFMLNDNAVVIKDANEGTIKISSIKSKQLEIFTNFVGDEAAIEEFNTKYFYKNDLTGFEIGYYENRNHTYGSTDGQTGLNIASWLYYVGEDGYNNIGTINSGAFVPKVSEQYSNYVSFIVEDGKLYVRGGDRKGEVQMMLMFFYTMPDGREFTYSYFFKIENGIYTTEDMPLEISDANAFRNINDANEPNDYILSSNIYLYNYEVITDTSKIKSLDGNNYTINIMSFASADSSSANLALFENISSVTTLKNLTVNYYYLDEVVFDSSVTNVNFAGLAISNSGVIYNCEVMSFDTGKGATVFNTHGLKINANNATISIAGFVLNNSGSITNSRVGGDNKLVTSFDYTEEKVVIIPQKQVINATLFNIKGAGTISGFVQSNLGEIASSFVKNVNIVNTYSQNATMTTAGFVTTNSGNISMCYVEGEKSNQTEISSDVGGLQGTGILAGFVYKNNGSITDSYSNVMLKTTNNQVGRLGAGFVYANQQDGKIERAHSFSKIADNNTSQLNFIGVTDTMEYNNLGFVKNCYYYGTEGEDAVSTETLYSTDIQALSNVVAQNSFYGYNFGSAYNNQNATWIIGSTGPKLVTTNNITHSVRYKDSIEGVQTTSSLDYVFKYVDEYDLGTANNPIIIRNANEFNNVFSGSINTETTSNNNIDVVSKKAFGTYRLVANIDLSTLIIDDGIEDNNEYYNLSSTAVTLTGEYAVISNRTGVFDGNGLTISNLSITNTSVNDNKYFGMFKAVVNGASINNLNVGLASGGVNADRTMAVGAITGKLEDASLSNIYLYNESTTESVEVIGSHVVGGVAGLVVGNGYVSGIRVSGVSVTATYNISNHGKEDEVNIPKVTSGDNTYTIITNLEELSFAGGAFGIVHIYTKEQLLQDFLDDDIDIRTANMFGVSVTGGMSIYGMTAGGVCGYIGKYVVARDVSLTVTRAIKAKIISYNCYAGGITGINTGSLYQVKAEYEAEWQKQIEEGIQTYYNGDLSFDRGQTDIFSEEDLSYAPIAVGGLVGRMPIGYMNIGYSKLNVVNEKATKAAGGVIGLIDKAGDSDPKIHLTEIYATGDVYAPNAGYVAGIVGLVSKSTTVSEVILNKVSALNMWSKESFDIFNKEKHSQILNALLPDREGEVYSKFDLTNISSFRTDGTIKFKDETEKDVNVGLTNDESYTITSAHFVGSYYDYVGVNVDDGAMIAPAFNSIGFYDAGNWTIKSGDLFPRIKYVSTLAVYEIYTKEDLRKIGDYGRNPEARFVVMTPELIDCTGWTTTYGVLKGQLVGKYATSGFSKLSVPVVSTLNGAKLSNLIFDNCISPFANESKGGTHFSHIIYNRCSVQAKKIFTVGELSYTTGAVAVTIVSGNTEFSSIVFNGTGERATGVYYLNNDGALINAGLLFARAASGGYEVTINDIKTDSNCKINVAVKDGSSVGMLFGHVDADVTINISDCDISGLVNISVKNCTDEPINIGFIGGYVHNQIQLENIKTNGISNGKFEFGVYVKIEGDGQPKINVGGFIGYANNLILANSEVKTLSYTGSDITLLGNYSFASVGGVVGEVNSFTYNNPLVRKDDEENAGDVIYGVNLKLSKEEYCKITVDTPRSDGTLTVGGIAGSVTTVSTKIDDSENNYKTLIYNGDIVLNQIVGSAGSVNVGGIIGSVVSGGTVKLKNATFAGTISAGNDNKNECIYHIGGIIGCNSDADLTISNTYAIGDILLNNADNYFNIISTYISYIGGVVGYAEQDLEISNTVSLTTIYSLYKNEKIVCDAVVGALAGSVKCKTIANVRYASNINLCVSDTTDCVSDTTDAINEKYNEIMLQTESGSIVPESLKARFNNEGTKLNPIIFKYEEHNTIKNDYEIVLDKAEDLQTYKSKRGELRKLYVKLEKIESIGSELENNNIQVNLQNTILFSDGGEIYTRVTAFNNIDNQSAISGVISRIFASPIDDAETSFNSKVLEKSNAGFVNQNYGVVYTCAAKETYSKYGIKGNSLLGTNFYGKITKSQNSNVGGFVCNNGGYIFGSYSNMIIEIISNNITVNVGGFAYKNTGIIDYSFALGYLTASDKVFNLDLFASVVNKTTEDKKEITSNCYSLFGVMDSNNTLSSGTITNNANVYYEADAVEYYYLPKEGEANNNAKKIYGENKFYSDKEGIQTYYKTDKEYNSNYPALYNKFEQLYYVRNDSTVYVHTKSLNKSGLASNFGYYDNDNKEGSIKYIVVPTTTAFINMTGNENYVLTRSFNFGYFGVEEAEGSTIKECCKAENSNAILATLSNVNIDGHGNSIFNVHLANKNLIYTLSNSKLKDLNIINIELNNSTGFIGENDNGSEITGITVGGTIKYTLTDDGICSGVLVGTNYAYIGTTAGLAENITEYNTSENMALYGCKINTDKLTGKNSTAPTYYFGCLVGQNVGGTVKNVMANLNDIKVEESKKTDKNNIAVQSLNFGGIVGLLLGEEPGSILCCGVETANVNIVGGNQVYVGGIVAVATKGTVSNCYTRSGCIIQAGAEDGDLVTQTSYIGGIVGFGNTTSNTLKISDCKNGADIYARAVWSFGEETRNVEHYDEKSDTTFVYIVKKGSSNANAGGIISNYLTADNVADEGADIDEDNNIIATRLQNTGVVSGGYSAYKPVGVFYTSGNMSARKYLLNKGWTSFLKHFGELLLRGRSILDEIPGIGWVRNKIRRAFSWHDRKLEEEYRTAHLCYHQIAGNSNEYNTKYGIYQSDQVLASIDVSGIADKDDFMCNWTYDWTFAQIEYKVLDYYKPNERIIFDQEISYNYNNSSDSCREYSQDGVNLSFNKDIIFTSTSNNRYTQLLEVYFDGICPTINNITTEGYDEENTKNVYTSTNRVNEYTPTGGGIGGINGYTLKCVTKDLDVKDVNPNSKLVFTICDTYTVHKLFDSNYLESKIDSGSFDKEGELIISNPTELEPVTGAGTPDNPYYFAFSTASLWKNLVYTINNNSKYQGEENIVIAIRTGSGSPIFVGSDVFDVYNGKLKFYKNSVLYGLKTYSYNYNSENYDTLEYGGIIKKSTSAQITNFAYRGDVVFANDFADNQDIIDREDNYKSSFGLIVGCVAEDGNVTINNPTITNLYAQIPDNISNRYKSISTMVGTAKGKVTITSAKIEINDFEMIGTMLLYEENSDRCAFGGLIGMAENTANVSIERAKVIVRKLNLVSQINIAGAIAGVNKGTLSLSGATSYLHNFNVASYKNTYVGGVVGYNDGTISSNGQIRVEGISSTQYMVLSADVIAPKKDAYVGGIVGFDKKGTEDKPDYISNSYIFLGNPYNTSDSTDNGTDKILAGFNSYDLGKLSSHFAITKNEENELVGDVLLRYLPTNAYAQELIGNKSYLLDHNVYVIVKNISDTPYDYSKYKTADSLTSIVNETGFSDGKNFDILETNEEYVKEITGTDTGSLNDKIVNTLAKLNYSEGAPTIDGLFTKAEESDGHNGKITTIRNAEETAENKLTVSEMKTYYIYSTSSSHFKMVNEFTLTFTSWCKTLKTDNIEEGYLESTLKEEYLVRFTTLLNNDILIEIIFNDVDNDSSSNGIFDDYIQSLSKKKGTVIFSYTYNELVESANELVGSAGEGKMLYFINLNNYLTEKDSISSCVAENYSDENGVAVEGDNREFRYTIINSLQSENMFIIFDGKSISFNETLKWTNYIEGTIYEKDSTGGSVTVTDVNSLVADRYTAEYTRTFATIELSDLTGNSYIFEEEENITPDASDITQNAINLSYNLIVNGYYDGEKIDEEKAIGDGKHFVVNYPKTKDGTLGANNNNVTIEYDHNYVLKDGEGEIIVNGEAGTYKLTRPNGEFAYNGKTVTIYKQTGEYRGKDIVIISLRNTDGSFIEYIDYIYYNTSDGNYVLYAELSYKMEATTEATTTVIRDANLIPQGASEIATRYYNYSNSTSDAVSEIVIKGLVYRLPNSVEITIGEQLTIGEDNNITYNKYGTDKITIKEYDDYYNKVSYRFSNDKISVEHE